mmetsp:Transcript_8476/g.52959  ORF Transcript_8476/g.52959 Transcript_8476/m.52959 type:complete len:316 (-) Transcript_8476:284-1231(-)
MVCRSPRVRPRNELLLRIRWLLGWMHSRRSETRSATSRAAEAMLLRSSQCAIAFVTRRWWTWESVWKTRPTAAFGSAMIPPPCAWRWRRSAGRLAKQNVSKHRARSQPKRRRSPNGSVCPQHPRPPFPTVIPPSTWTRIRRTTCTGILWKGKRWTRRRRRPTRSASNVGSTWTRRRRILVSWTHFVRSGTNSARRWRTSRWDERFDYSTFPSPLSLSLSIPSFLSRTCASRCTPWLWTGCARVRRSVPCRCVGCRTRSHRCARRVFHSFLRVHMVCTALEIPPPGVRLSLSSPSAVMAVTPSMPPRASPRATGGT